MKKRVFRRFRYRSCDAMACFLEEMAGKGWGFSGWRWGMVFERELRLLFVMMWKCFRRGVRWICVLLKRLRNMRSTAGKRLGVD